MIASFNSLTSLLDTDRKCDGRMQERGRATVTGTIWSLHRVIANPDSSVDDVRTAKRLLLRLLEKTKAFPRLETLEMEMRDDERQSRRTGSFREGQRRSSESNRSRAVASAAYGRS